MDPYVLDRTFEAARHLLGEKATSYESILLRIKAVQDGDPREDPSRISFDFGCLQSSRGDLYTEEMLEVTNLLLSAINILSLERRLNGNVPEKELRPFVEFLRRVHPTRLQLIGE